jgi:hypothetical protein
MNKFNLQEDEKNRILSMHKALIKEQATAAPAADAPKSISDQLQVFITNGCAKTGKVVKMKSSNPQKQFAIKQESVKTPGKFRYLFIDNTVGVSDETGKFQVLPNKWACNTGAVQANVSAEKDKASAEQAAATASKTNVDKTKKEGDWKTKEDLLKTDTEQNIENPVMYEKKEVNGVMLYRRVASSGIGAALTDDQKKIIDKWTNKGAKLRKDLDPEQAKTWASRVVSPASEGYFSEDLIMYFDPSITFNDATITTKIQDAVKERIPKDKKDCKNTIEAYYWAFKRTRPLEPNEFEALKAKTQACKNEYGGNWGGPLSGGRRMDNFLETMSGGIGGPSRAGDDAKWRLN